MPQGYHSIYIGTSGWSYKHWLGTFYPEGVKNPGMLPYYIRNFNTVELNSPFYRLPDKETFAKWKNVTPPDFIFSVKASRYITHMKKLKDPAESLAKFMENVSALDEKLGPILFQLPPHWKLNLPRLGEFLEKLPSTYRYVFEFRNPTWYNDEVYSLLKAHNCAFCLYELAGHTTPFQVTSDFVYIRLHGPGNKYEGNYTENALKTWGDKCLEWSKTRDVFVYFDNDIGSHAPYNAKNLKEIIGE